MLVLRCDLGRAVTDRRAGRRSPARRPRAATCRSPTGSRWTRRRCVSGSSSRTAGSPSVELAISPSTRVSSTQRVPASSLSGTGGTGENRSRTPSPVSTRSAPSCATVSARAERPQVGGLGRHHVGLAGHLGAAEAVDGEGGAVEPVGRAVGVAEAPAAQVLPASRSAWRRPPRAGGADRRPRSPSTRNHSPSDVRGARRRARRSRPRGARRRGGARRGSRLQDALPGRPVPSRNTDGPGEQSLPGPVALRPRRVVPTAGGGPCGVRRSAARCRLR